MKISANSIRAGNILVHENNLWIVNKMPQHTQPGKGGAYVQVEMRNLKTGVKTNVRFNSTEYIEKAYLDQREFQYLYNEGDKLVFMDNENFEQIYLPKDFLGSRLPFLVENMNVKVEFYQEDPVNIELPTTVVLEIVETEPVIKGATATASDKPAILSNGIRVMVPSYIESGQKIVVKIENSSYVERAK